MATFRKIYNGMEMEGCALYEYLLTSKGFCCEKGWNWEDLDTQMTMTGRDWLAYWALNGSPCAECEAPINTVLPTISGLPVVGQTLTAGDGTWSGTAPITYTYQWKRNGFDIVGATNGIYIITIDDIGADITLEVVANNACAGGGVSAVSGTFGPIAGLEYVEFAFTDLSGTMPVADYTDVADWNTLFTSTYAAAVVNNGANTVRLYGDTNVVLDGLAGAADNIIGMTDTGTVFDCANSAFTGCINLATFSVSGTFNTASIGGTVGDDNVFAGIVGGTITITIPAALMTNDGGNPDGDIAALIANNTVTVNTF